MHPFVPLALVAVVATPLAAQSTPPAFANFEGSQTHPICLSPSKTRLFAVSTDLGRLCVYDLANPSLPTLSAEIPVGIEPVAVAARTEDEVWVVDQVSDDVSVVSVTAGTVIDTLRTGDEPQDVVFAGGKAFVSIGGRNQVWVFDATTRAKLAQVPLDLENPRALVVDPTGTKVYALSGLSGNHTTVVPPHLLPPPLLPDPKAALIVDSQSPPPGITIAYTVRDHDVVPIDVATHVQGTPVSGVGTINLGLACRPGTSSVYVTNTDARNLTFFEPVLRGRVVENQVTRIDLGVAPPTVTKIDLNPGFDYA
ncbi:MAG TPA: hypothetical protein VKE69_01135, partial [Planctomycetota bacterium]|nr:hypothetical protein [Planctomycetota bacterium]